MPVSSEELNAHVHARTTGECLLIELRGRWRVTEPRPTWEEAIAGQKPGRVIFDGSGVESWDSSLVLFLHEAHRWARSAGAEADLSGLPPAMQKLAGQLAVAREKGAPVDRSHSFLTVVGLATLDVLGKAREISTFIGECVLSAIYLLKRPDKFRWRDCVAEMQQCGAMALPIVGLISFLVGLTLAYTAAVILRQFGADIWVADLVGLTMVREMGSVMTAVVLAGRTGAAFAATLGNMKANEEIDALQTLGIRPVDFLVVPRLVALAAMMPLLALYANGLGILGGMLVGYSLLSIPPTAYWIETQSIIDLSDVSSGLIKACTFGLIVGLAGCLRGLQADRSAAGVGRAATSAVVTAILLIIVADSLYAVIFNILGI